MDQITSQPVILGFITLAGILLPAVITYLSNKYNKAKDSQGSFVSSLLDRIKAVENQLQLINDQNIQLIRENAGLKAEITMAKEENKSLEKKLNEALGKLRLLEVSFKEKENG